MVAPYYLQINSNEPAFWRIKGQNINQLFLLAKQNKIFNIFQSILPLAEDTNLSASLAQNCPAGEDFL